ncbi:MAG: phosphoribosylamine--glycine ligase [Candidatus Binataceae bacterium]
MKVLIVGSGGREHALCWRLNQSPSVKRLFYTGGNPGIDRLAESSGISPRDIQSLVRFVRDNKIDLTVVGPEDPLAAGIGDEFERNGLTMFGPGKAAAQLEASKSFAKDIMREAGVATAAFEVFDTVGEARRYVERCDAPLVVKADGLALGKGVTVCDDRASALNAVNEALEARRFGAAGARIVIEERLHGEELSFFALCDGADAIPLGFVQDHKTIFDGDRGPNTGGMGAYSPVPRYDDAFTERVMAAVIRPTLVAMGARGTPFHGVLFAGLMIGDDGVIKVLEYNVRFGDPECEPLMMRFEGDLGETLLAIAQGRARDAVFRLSNKSAATVVMASRGYPGEYTKGLPIHGLERIEGGEPSPLKVKWALEKTRIKVFHAGTALHNGQLVTEGGRVLMVTAMAATLQQAVATAYQVADLIEFEGKHVRGDIGHRALATDDLD